MAINEQRDFFSVLGSKTVKAVPGGETRIRLTPEVHNVSDDFYTVAKEVGRRMRHMIVRILERYLLYFSVA